MKKSGTLFLMLVLFSSAVTAQYTKYIVRFTDKTGTPFSITQPSKFLSQKSIDRRNKQKIAINESDLPVVARYIDSVRLSGNVSILNQSKWLNQVCIETNDAAALAKINTLPFVLGTSPVKKVSNQQILNKNKFNNEIKDIRTPSGNKELSYGNAFEQIHIHEGEYLHNAGFRGEGMLVSVIDAGFFHYQSLPAFDSVRLNDQIVETFDFVKNKISVNEEDAHGMYCFSIMAGNLPGQMVGSSPKANYLLYRSEEAGSESPIEEHNWAAAAERSDSAGADIITTSLGYSTFDDPSFDYTYADMDGRTTIIAHAASIATKKGMILLVAAGNDGNNSWKFISSPADVDSLITVGAVNVSGVAAGFSSYGPSADGRIKPTVASVGVATVISSTNGNIASGNGTSFSTPNLAGLVTCLWQAFPEFNNMEIIEAVKKSSSIYNNPNDRIGYGIPNFRLAFEDLKQQRTIRSINTILGDKTIRVFPNPVVGPFTIAIKPQNTATGIFRLYDATGKLVLAKQVAMVAGEPQAISFENVQYLSRGIYFLKFTDGYKAENIQLMVQ